MNPRVRGEMQMDLWGGGLLQEGVEEHKATVSGSLPHLDQKSEIMAHPSPYGER